MSISAPSGLVPEYEFFKHGDDWTITPTDVHHVAVHFCFHPLVPTSSKIVFFGLSLSVLALQIAAIIGLLGAKESELTPQAIEDEVGGIRTEVGGRTRALSLLSSLSLSVRSAAVT